MLHGNLAIAYGDLAISFGDLAMLFSKVAMLYSDLAILFGDLAILYGNLAISFGDLAIPFGKHIRHVSQLKIRFIFKPYLCSALTIRRKDKNKLMILTRKTKNNANKVIYSRTNN